jgi:hypothetical protein
VEALFERHAGAQVGLADPRAAWLMIRMPEPEPPDASTMASLVVHPRSDDGD